MWKVDSDVADLSYEYKSSLLGNTCNRAYWRRRIGVSKIYQHFRRAAQICPYRGSPNHSKSKKKGGNEWSKIIYLFQVAVKLIKKSAIENKADLVRIRREIRIMSALNHPNIIQIFEGTDKMLSELRAMTKSFRCGYTLKSFWLYMRPHAHDLLEKARHSRLICSLKPRRD